MGQAKRRGTYAQRVSVAKNVALAYKGKNNIDTIARKISKYEIKAKDGSTDRTKEMVHIWSKMPKQERRDMVKALQRYIRLSTIMRDLLKNEDMTGIVMGKNLVVNRRSGSNLMEMQEVYFGGYKDNYFRGKLCDMMTLIMRMAKDKNIEDELTKSFCQPLKEDELNDGFHQILMINRGI